MMEDDVIVSNCAGCEMSLASRFDPVTNRRIDTQIYGWVRDLVTDHNRPYCQTCFRDKQLELTKNARDLSQLFEINQRFTLWRKPKNEPTDYAPPANQATIFPSLPRGQSPRGATA